MELTLKRVTLTKVEVRALGQLFDGTVVAERKVHKKLVKYGLVQVIAPATMRSRKDQVIITGKGVRYYDAYKTLQARDRLVAHAKTLKCN